MAQRKLSYCCIVLQLDGSELLPLSLYQSALLFVCVNLDEMMTVKSWAKAQGTLPAADLDLA